MVENRLNVSILLSSVLLASGLSSGCSSSSMKISDSSVGVQGRGSVVNVVPRRDARVVPDDVSLAVPLVIPIVIPIFFELPEHIVDVVFLQEWLAVFKVWLNSDAFSEYQVAVISGYAGSLLKAFTERLQLAVRVLGDVVRPPELAEGQRDRTLLYKEVRAKLQVFGFLRESAIKILAFVSEDNVVDVIRAVEQQADQCIIHLDAIA